MKTLNIDVYEAAMRRLDYVFSEFEHVYVSFSGGKDSGLLLSLCLQYLRERGINRKIGLFHQDFEAQYSETTKYVERVFSRDLDLIEPYWCCLPMACKTATSMHEQYWIPWEPEKQAIWVRDLPAQALTIDNHPFDFYRYGMLQEEIYEQFGGWYQRHKGGGKTIGLIGIRAHESLSRYRAIMKDKSNYQGTSWTTRTVEGLYTGYPIYDWRPEDIWTANAKFSFDYNRLYDLFYEAGVPLNAMRVASPFNDWAIGSLKLYRVIEPEMWSRMVGRVNGANFCAIYGGTSAVAWKRIKLPKGHTWRSYVEFLLKTLPTETRKTYEEKFATSIKFWQSTGGVLSSETIAELKAMGIPIQIHGKTNYKTSKERVTFAEYQDDLDIKEFQSVPTYKRMAICILKNDHLCKYMGFSQTKKETERRQAAIQKYMAL